MFTFIQFFNNEGPAPFLVLEAWACRQEEELSIVEHPDALQIANKTENAIRTRVLAAFRDSACA
jgi:hypothetical protein